MSDIGSSNISFSSLKSKYSTSSVTSASKNDNLRDGKTNSDIHLSYFRGTTLSDGSVIPSSNDISINSHFKDKTFGSAYSDITTNFLEISNRFIYSTASDYTGAYDVSETQIGLSGSYQIYIGIKVTVSPTYVNDIAIAGVQVLDSNNSEKTTWIFNTTSGDNWETYTSQTSQNSGNGFPITPSTASGYSYSSISTGGSYSRFSYATSTGSSYTGAAGGISGSTGDFTVGNGTISQVNSSYYLYRETSGSTLNTGTVMRSPSITLAAGDKIRVAHLVAGMGSNQMDPNDCLYLGAATASSGGGAPK